MSARRLPDPSFWQGRRVLLTGHSGFKGTWISLWLSKLGAEVYGFALPPEGTPSLWAELGTGLLAQEVLADLNDEEALRASIQRAQPQIVLHLAAQALVRRGIADPVSTIATNALGTARLLSALRGAPGLEAVLAVTSDKVYAPSDDARHAEQDPLGGIDPYSASKAAAELIVRSFARTYMESAGVRVATARAGNAIGGGDWSVDRLVPDIWRAARRGEPVRLRAPDAVRPWQHVLEPLAGYLVYAEAMLGSLDVPPSLNFGPPPDATITVRQLAELVGSRLGLDRPWIADEGEHPPETHFLSLDSSLAEKAIGWTPRLDARQAAEWTAAWYSAHSEGGGARGLCLDQIQRYETLA